MRHVQLISAYPRLVTRDLGYEATIGGGIWYIEPKRSLPKLSNVGKT